MDHNLQNEILTFLEDIYPQHISTLKFINEVKFPGNVTSKDEAIDFYLQLTPKVLKECEYLHEHKCIEITNRDRRLGVYTIKLTATGRDRLEPDGGLTAYFNTRTIRFDRNSITDLVETGLIKANIDENYKQSIIKKIKTLPINVIAKIGNKMMEKAIDDPIQLVNIVSNIIDKC